MILMFIHQGKHLVKAIRIVHSTYTHLRKKWGGGGRSSGETKRSLYHLHCFVFQYHFQTYDPCDTLKWTKELPHCALSV